MRFLLVTPYTIPDFAGSGINAFNFARFMARKGLPVTLLSLNRNLALGSHKRVEEVYIRRLPYFNRNYLLKLLSLIFILPGYLLCVFRSDVIIIYGGYLIAWELLILFCKLLNRKVIFQSLLNDADDAGTIISRKSVMLKGFYRWILRRIDLYHALNTHLKEEFIRYVPDEGRVLLNPQGVDTGIFSPVSVRDKEIIRDSLGLDQEKLIIIAIGSVIPRKGYDEMFRIIAGLDIPCQLLVAGEYEFNEGHFLGREGKYARDLIQAAKESAGDKITFLGGVSNIVNYIRASDIALFNSQQEGLPNALLEVMACGIPPVMREYPGMKDYFIQDRKNALVFRKPAGMADCLCQLCQDRELGKRIGSDAQAAVEKDASFEMVLKHYRERLTLR